MKCGTHLMNATLSASLNRTLDTHSRGPRLGTFQTQPKIVDFITAIQCAVQLLYGCSLWSPILTKSAFEIVTRQQPLLPNTLDSPQSVRSPFAWNFSKEWKQNVDIARSCLEKAQKRMKKYADQNRRFIEFSAGDLVMVKVPDPRLSKASRGRDPRLMQKKDDTRNQPSRPQLELTKMKEKVAEAILNHQVTRTAKREHTEYLVKWKGCSSEENTWERVTNLKAFLPLVEAYHTSHAPRTSLSQVGRMSRAARTLGP
ncbi:UNVERIFIED_CONTAM: hypothetical protein Sradi_0176700 [Sesamum radiatum]|uniref:Chromo domain-containing protein n=1 Tax=Sesamum radiatum TaxID=300843 RepID=A0AAW2W035_SESRA